VTHDEMERAIEFIIQQQARFEASAQAKIEAILDQQAKFAADMMQIKELGGELAKSQVRMQNALAGLADSHKKLAESHERLAASHERLAESQQETEKRLQSVLKALERGFGGNGRGRKTS
jgi:chromosome segregation ATPase